MKICVFKKECLYYREVINSRMDYKGVYHDLSPKLTFYVTDKYITNDRNIEIRITNDDIQIPILSMLISKETQYRITHIRSSINYPGKYHDAVEYFNIIIHGTIEKNYLSSFLEIINIDDYNEREFSERAKKDYEIHKLLTTI